MKIIRYLKIVSLCFLLSSITFSCTIKDPGLRQILGLPKLEAEKPSRKEGEVKEYYDDGKLKSVSHYKDSLLHGIRKSYRKDGSLLSVVEYKDGKKFGIGKNYYDNGKVQAEVRYVNDIKHGETKWYYESGKLYRVNPFKDGKLHGTQKKYHENGVLQSEIPYFEGKPGIGGKEYDESGNDITNRYSLILEEQNHVYFNNTYKIFLNVEPKHYGVSYYVSVEPNDKFINNRMMLLINNKGKGEYTEYVFRGNNVMRSVVFFAVVKTKYHNELVIKKSFNVVVEHR